MDNKTAAIEALSDFKKYDDHPVEKSNELDDLFGHYMEKHSEIIRKALILFSNQ